jgi:DnaJ-class molecular chaperone
MTRFIKDFIKSQNLLVCLACDGEGEVGYFCGHDITTKCYHCDGNGIIRSLKKEKHRRECSICKGKGGLGCCDNKGYLKWESYELVDSSLFFK